MKKSIVDLYKVPNVEQYEDVNLLALSESCGVLEERVYDILQNLPEHERLIIEDYIRTRDDLELETVKMALHWGSKYCRQVEF